LHAFSSTAHTGAGYATSIQRWCNIFILLLLNALVRKVSMVSLLCTTGRSASFEKAGIATSFSQKSFTQSIRFLQKTRVKNE
jgi:hypothetical protein